MLKYEGTWVQGGQGSDDTFELLNPMEARKMIKEHEESAYGSELAPSEVPSDLQISAARGKLLADSNPACCFGLNGPYGKGRKSDVKYRRRPSRRSS